MRKENTSSRLKEIMLYTGINQVDILRKCQPLCEKYGEKISKSHLSQWVNGINEPNQRKLYILGEALDVSEPWLMGYDVPMERNKNFYKIDGKDENNEPNLVVDKEKVKVSTQEEQLLYYFNSLTSDEDKRRVLRMLKSYVDSTKDDTTNNCG